MRLLSLGTFCYLAVAAMITSSAWSSSLVIEGKDGWLFPKWESLTEVHWQQIDKSIELIAKAKELLAAKNIKLVVFVVPMKASVYSDFLPSDETLGSDMQSRYEKILARFQSENILNLDLRPIFNRVKGDGHEVFYRTDYHWTAWSAEGTADAVAKLLLSEGMTLGKKGSNISVGAWKSERRYGDLANLLPPDRRVSLGEETFTVRNYVANAGLLDAGEDVVQVVGNSFVQPFLGFTQRLSRKLDRPVGLTWNYGDVSQWATFLRAVESQDFRAKRPSIVVWQLTEGRLEYGPNATDQWSSGSTMIPEKWVERLSAALKSD